MLERLLGLLPFHLYNRILIIDVDDLFANETFVRFMMEKGIQIIQYEDPEIFRSIYEEEIKGTQDDIGGNVAKYLVLAQGGAYVPYDILQCFHCRTISFKDIFPKLSYPVVRELDTDCIGPLLRAYQHYSGEELGDNGTKDYVLKSVYGIYAEQINTLMSLLKHLVPIYYQGLSIPLLIGNYLVDILSINEGLSSYPLHKLISTPHTFFKFMQEQWHLYVNNMQGKELEEELLIDFNDYDIKVYMNNLFQEDYLRPIMVYEHLHVPVGMEAGVTYNTAEGLRRRIGERLNLIKEKLENIKSYKDWFSISNLWGDVLVMLYRVKPPRDFLGERVALVQKMLLKRFKGWMQQEYSGLHSLSYVRSPVVVHKIPWYIDSQMKQQGLDKVALLVVDGMSVDNWKVIKGNLKNQFNYQEKFAYAWVPTMTSFSRQAIFSGEIPIHFEGTAFSTNYDERHWKKFWVERGQAESSIAYIRNVKTLREKALISAVEDKHTKILGIVINAVDNFLHGAQLSRGEIHNSIRFWVENVNFEQFVQGLLDKGFAVYITSDHGNIESIGIGKPKEGLLVETAGERIRVYSADLGTSNLLAGYDAYLWEGLGLPRRFHYFLCNKNYSFTRKNERVMSHGGISLEEVIVPFVYIGKGD